MCAGQRYEEVARLLTHGLLRMGRRKEAWRAPAAAAIGRARLRLGPEPLRALSAQVCHPVAPEETTGAQRWEIENTLDAIKTHQDGRPRGEVAAIVV